MSGEKKPALGILLLDTVFPRIPGDIGNERSYPYPVIIKRVKGATVQRVVYDADPTLRDSFVDAAVELEEAGVVAITSSCGFLSPIQVDVADAVNIPVFLSSLMQVNLAHAMTRGRVGILTANAQSLTETVLIHAGITADIPVATIGLEDVPAFSDPILKDGASLDRQKIEQAVVEKSQKLLTEYPDISAFVFECHNLAPYSKSVQESTGKPVFDIIDFANWVYSTVVKQSFPFE